MSESLNQSFLLNRKKNVIEKEQQTSVAENSMTIKKQRIPNSNSRSKRRPATRPRKATSSESL